MQRNESGYITLMAVLIAAAAGTAVALTLLVIGIDFTRSSGTLADTNKAKALANACAEMALENLETSDAYAGSETLDIGDGECEIFPLGGTGSTNRTVQVEGRVNGAVRRVRVVVAETSPQMTLTSWQEVADF